MKKMIIRPAFPIFFLKIQDVVQLYYVSVFFRSFLNPPIMTVN